MADIKDPFVGSPGDVGSPGTPNGVGGQGGQGGCGGHGERGPAGPAGPVQSLHDLYEQVGRSTGRIEELSLKIDENRSRQRCGEHDLRMTRLEEVIGAPKRPSALVPAVTSLDLERVVMQMDDSLESKVASQVLVALQAQERLAQERRTTTAAAMAEETKARWARLQWIVGVIATLLTSGTVVGWCQTSNRMDADRQAVVKALREQPPPQIVKVPVPAPVQLVPAPAPKEP